MIVVSFCEMLLRTARPDTSAAYCAWLPCPNRRPTIRPTTTSNNLTRESPLIYVSKYILIHVHWVLCEINSFSLQNYPIEISMLIQGQLRNFYLFMIFFAEGYMDWRGRQDTNPCPCRNREQMGRNCKRLTGRTENSIKNHWNATKRRQYSRRKCRTKYPRPSSLLQNYIKSLNLDGKSDTMTPVPPPLSSLFKAPLTLPPPPPPLPLPPPIHQPDTFMEFCVSDGWCPILTLVMWRNSLLATSCLKGVALILFSISCLLLGMIMGKAALIWEWGCLWIWLLLFSLMRWRRRWIWWRWSPKSISKMPLKIPTCMFYTHPWKICLTSLEFLKSKFRGKKMKLWLLKCFDLVLKHLYETLLC